jgi:crotonobetainyl-CoA:carnitine CoA-transferase CaiB-like acyl-CoA transferase
VGSDCDLSLFDTALSMLTYPAIWALNGDFVPTRTHHSAHPSLVPFQAFEASDGWIVIACPKEKFWTRLATTIGRPELGTTELYATFTARRQHADTLLPILDSIFVTRPVIDWLTELRAAGVPCGPVNTVPEALADAQTEARGMIVETEHPRFGTVRQVRSAARVGNSVPKYRRAPLLNEDFDYVLRDVLHYDTDRIATLAGSATEKETS